MKKLMNRCLAFVLALVLCFSLLPALTLTADAATVTYRYSGNYIYNWGMRGEDATFLSPNAEKFYEDNNTSYEELAALSGSSEQSSVPSSALYEKLQSIMESNHTYETSYNGTKTLFKYTDCQNNGYWNEGKISSFYSGTGIGPSWDGGWNREHTWPNSKGDDSGNGENDIMMLRPTSTSENSSRGNKAYGEVTSSSYYNPNSESSGQYDLRGDVARIMLFVYCRWGNTGSMWGASGVMQSREVLLKWVEEDPVDTWELGRNDSTESITGTRNIFVDYPELIFVLFGEEIPADMTTPSGMAASSGYKITATTNNSSYGTVTQNGRIITAVPKTGYYASGYTVTSGTANVTQNGNTFTVDALTDCTVRINFAKRTSATVSFMENGSVTSTVSAYTGDSITLPGKSATVDEAYTFVGWVASTLDSTDVRPATIYTSGSSYQVNSTQTLYALYSNRDGATGSGGNIFTKYSGSLVEGDYVITYYANSEDGAMVANVGSGNRFDYQVVTISDDEILNPDQSIIWHIAPTTNGYYTIYNDAKGMYAGSTSSSIRATLTATAGDTAMWKVTGTDVYNFQNKATTSLYLRRNNAFGFGGYASATGGELTLFKAQGGTVYYSTSASSCEHQDDTVYVPAVAASCTETGNTAGYYCNDCETYYGGYSVTEALGHAWGSWAVTTAPTCTAAGEQTRTCSRCNETEKQAVAIIAHSYSTQITPPTEADQGYTTYTCSGCGYSYVSDYVEALGYTYTVHFSVPAGVAKIDDMLCGKNGISLPAADAPVADRNYKFIGWTDAIVEDATDTPAIFEANSTYKTDAETTLYALYTYSVGGTGATEYVLTDIADIQDTDTVVITVTHGTTTYALDSSNGTSDAPDAVIVSVANGKLATMPADSLLWNMVSGSTGYVIYKNGQTDTWLYTTSSNNGVRVGTGAAKFFTYKSDYLCNTTYTRYMGVYRTNPDWRTYTSIHANIQNETYGFYVKQAGGTLYYTTQIPCVHEDQATVPVLEATCTSAGYTAGVYCNDCESYISGHVEIPATGHSSAYVNNGDGTHDYTCSVCGTVEIDNEAHTYTDGSCACGEAEPVAEPSIKGIKTTASIGLEEVIYIRATVAFTNAEGTDDTTALTKEQILANGRVLFWHGNNMPANWDEAVVGTETMNSGLTDAGEWGGLNEYWGISHGIEAKQYTDKVYFRTYIVVDGVEYYGEVAEYSVQTYAENQLKKAASTAKAKKLHTLLVAMLNYGAAAQAQFNYSTGNLANANIQSFITGGTLDEANLPGAWNESMMNIRAAVPAEMVGEFTGNGLSRTNRTLNLAGAIFARMVFGLNVTNDYAAKPADGTTVTFYFWSEKDYDKLAAAGTALSKDNATYTKEGVLDYSAKYGYEYLGDTDGIAAKQMRDTIYVACVFAQPDGTEYTSGVEIYNAHVYAASKLAQSQTNTLGKLLQEMVVYGEAAKAYFG